MWTKHKLEEEDIRIPTARNPILYRGLHLEADTLFYKGQEYGYEDVKRLNFSWRKTRKVAVGISQVMNLSFDLSGRDKRVKLTTNRVFVSYKMFRSINQKHKDLYSAYLYLARQSLPYRMRDYMDDMKRLGYMDFGNCKVYADGRFELATSIGDDIDVDVLKLVEKEMGLFDPRTPSRLTVA